MAKVPDLFEDLKNCYSENEEYSSDIDHLSLNQLMALFLLTNFYQERVEFS
uniref:Interleukin 1 alpha n=1 Tax=Sus scrofa TaxID=9823 RepID=A0A5G2QZE8_PIG